jgi:oxepin-CoA hydrolase/3-oxo-5,6-dehydrosuberyl-CoA semialdehyde dehydrogenase
MKTLQSYALGAWHAGDGEPQLLHDARTGEAIAGCSTAGLDFAGVLRHGREVGGPALRELGFAARGKMLKALSAALHEHREELIELSGTNGGTTRGDAKFDIDGATGTLAAYASFAKRLPDRGFLTDGDGMQLGRTARWWGRHVLVPRPGVAVHINAFNFPAWGQMEKMACSLLAGMPVIEKPGTPTALLAWRVAEITVESGILPEGSYQFLCGSVGDLLDHMGPHDALAFTGSSGTAAKLRGNENLVRNNVRVNVEADSLNAAVLAPDVDTDGDTFDLFVQNVALDMTQKAGQKCTAVRRILVPADKLEEVEQALVDELARVKVGDPLEKGTRMGPVASAAQHEGVLAGIAQLAKHARVACGGVEPPQSPGYYVSPTLLVADDAANDVFHADEVFGPVAAILPYEGSAGSAIGLVNRGGGGLVASLYSDDAAWTEAVVTGIAPWHGRVWIGSKRAAGQALPPGMVLPQMVHGGPGRAGGGEELGGLRGLEFYLQRTALQGFQGFLEGTFGEPQSAGD